MKKLKSNGETLDRLSELHDSLIHEILSFLEMRDVVKTTLLSKRWKYLWTTTPCLDFAECGCDPFQIRNFVSRALTLWRGTRLRKFSIYLMSVGFDAALLSSDLDLWVRFAKERNVEEFRICFPPLAPLYCPPQCLYECSSLRKLKLLGCNLQIPGNVQWDRLTWLRLYVCSFPEGLIDKVLSSSPNLETFKLCYIHKAQNLSIRSNSLKKLQVSAYLDESSVLTIWAPNLEALSLIEKPYGKYLLTDVSSLTDVYLGFSGKSSALSEQALCQILSPIKHAVTVRLSANCLKVLGDRKGKYSFSPLLNVELLRIDSDLTELRELVGVLEIFPKLKMLIIDWRFKNNAGELFRFNVENYTMSVANMLKSNLLQLRTAKVTCYSYEPSIFEFIGFLLKHATMIEKMVIQVQEVDKTVTDGMFLAAQKMASLRRSFPNVELILC